MTNTHKRQLPRRIGFRILLVLLQCIKQSNQCTIKYCYAQLGISYSYLLSMMNNLVTYNILTKRKLNGRSNIFELTVKGYDLLDALETVDTIAHDYMI